MIQLDQTYVRRGIMRSRSVLSAGLLIVLGTTWVVWNVSRRIPAKRIYRIGWVSNPPSQTGGPQSSPTGYAADTIKEAARRSGIRLEWVERTDDAEHALRNGGADLWPIMVITEERKHYLHFSDPYSLAEQLLLVTANSSYQRPGDIGRGTISHPRNLRYRELLKEAYPASELLEEPSVVEAVRDVCSGTSQAALAEARAALRTLLTVPPCRLRVIPIEAFRFNLGIAATFDAASAADTLRDEIGRMAGDGTLSAIMARWGHPAGGDLMVINTLEAAKIRARYYEIGSGVVGALFLLAVAFAVDYRRARNRLRETDRALQQKERELRLVADSLTEMVMAYDMQENLIYFNPAVERLTGYRPEDLRHTKLDAWIHPEDRARLSEFREKRFSGFSFADVEFRLIRKDGSEKWISATSAPLLDEQGRQIGAISTGRDITERKQAEEALRQSQERFRILFESAPDAIFIVDERLNFLMVNNAACAQLRYSRDQLLALSFAGIAPSELAESVRNALRQGGDDRLTFTGAHIRADKTTLPVELHLRKIHFDGHMAAIGVARDITEREQAQHQRLELEQQLQQAQKLESIGRLAGGIAHDFNNLLTVINGYSSLILSGPPAGADILNKVEHIKDAGGRAANLTQQLLAFSRKQIMKPEALDVNAVVADAGRILRRLLGEDIELQTVLAPSVGAIVADSGHLGQVLMNLAVNARDAMPNGGKLVIETANAELDHTYAATHSEVTPGRYVMIAVSDTGCGMDEPTRRRMFEPFFTTKSTDKGTGLGLSTVYGIVTQNKGAISVDSEPGRGTTFRLYFPRSEEQAKSHVSQRPVRSTTRGSATILVVEDESNVRRLACEVLSEAGYRVLEAARGEDALSLAAALPDVIHLLMTDVVMPGMNGRELARRLQASRPRLEVLYTSGYVGSAVVQREVLVPEVSYLAKPFTADELISKVCDILSPSESAESQPG